MMNPSLISMNLLLIICIAFCQAEKHHSILTPNLDYPHKCVTKIGKDNLLILGVGQERASYLGDCRKYECRKEGKNFVLTTYSCEANEDKIDGSVIHLSTNSRKRYPECCKADSKINLS
ncbi:UNVERIFIED_CONTAM: hypothetical protein RMT77_000680 [Armadillidium vulgare]